MSKKCIEIYKQFAQCIDFPVVMFEADTGRVLYMNYEAEVVLGKQVEQITMETKRVIMKADFWELLHTKKSIMWHRLRILADGHDHAVSGFVHEFEENGTLIYMVMFEAQMKLGSFVLERVLSQAGIVSIHASKQENNYRVEYVSKNINVYGYTSEQVYDGQITFRDIICEQDFSRVDRAVREAAAHHEEDLVLECRVFTEARELVPVRVMVHYVYDECDVFDAMEILVFDLREELYRKKENDYLNYAIDKMKNVVIVKKYKPGHQELAYISPNAGMVGMNVDALRKGRKLTEDYIHPADREQVMNTIYQAIANGITDCAHTYRMVRDDGKQIWVLDEFTVNRSEDDEAQISFLLTDITEQKMMEQELAAAKAELPKEGKPVEKERLIQNLPLQMDEEMRSRLQEMAEILNGGADYYNVVLDVEGRLLTKPVGPMKDMGQFYDLFERPQFKEKFAESSERAKNQMVPISNTFLMNDLEIHMILAPIVIQEVVNAYWVLTDFKSNAITILGDVAGGQWKLANVIAKSFYADDLVQRESKRRMLCEMQLEREQQGRKLFKDLTKVMVEKGEAALPEICQKSALYMDVTNIGIYVENKESGNAEKYYTWNHLGEEQEFFDKMVMPVSGYRNFTKCMGEHRTVIADKKSQDSAILKEMLYHSGADSMIVALMTLGDKVKGYVVFAGVGKNHSFEERDAEFAALVTNLFEEMLLSGHKHRHGEIAKESFLEAYEHIREAVFMKDNRSGDIIYANKAMGKLYGYDVVGMAAKDIVVDEMEHYRNMSGIRKRFIANKKVTKWQSYMKELDQIMNIVEIHLEAFGGDYSLIILKKNKNKNKS